MYGLGLSAPSSILLRLCSEAGSNGPASCVSQFSAAAAMSEMHCFFASILRATETLCRDDKKGSCSSRCLRL